MKREYRRSDFEDQDYTKLSFRTKVKWYIVSALVVLCLAYLGGIEYLISDWFGG